jgi:DNA repair exonuclease SbcCD nuclease subunit
MALARFLQVSDLHLGRPFAWLPADRRDERRRDQQRVLEQAVVQAIERACDAILVPGDLFDAVRVDAGTLAFAVKTFEMAGCPPVFVAPGNHDAYAPASPTWNPRLLEARGLRWPDHVHVFDTGHWSMRPLPGSPDVRVWGRCFTSNVESTDRPLSAAMLDQVRHGESGGVDIAVFHGSREGQCPPAQKVTAPFSDDEAMGSPFTYHAVGHYHVPSRLEAPDHVDSPWTSSGARLAYAGSAVALDLSETGRHGAIEVRVTYGDRRPHVEVEPVELDRRRVLDVTADLTGCASGEPMDRRVMKALDQAGAGELDMATVRLTGRLPAGVRWTAPGAQLRSRVFHMHVRAGALRTDWDLTHLREGAEPRTTEEKFARRLLEQIDAAGDGANRVVLERALEYGLDAFRLREVTPVLEEAAE